MINKKSIEQKRIDRELFKLKAWYYNNYPLCIFCGHSVYNKPWDLAHKIRRSWGSSLYTRFELQTMKKNVGPGHRDCHTIFDDKPNEAIYLPLFFNIMEEIKDIEPNYFSSLLASVYNDILLYENNTFTITKSIYDGMYRM